MKQAYTDDQVLPHPKSRRFLEAAMRSTQHKPMIQGLRDLFGAHTYRRVDAEGTYHVRWGQDGEEVRTDS